MSSLWKKIRGSPSHGPTMAPPPGQPQGFGGSQCAELTASAAPLQPQSPSPCIAQEDEELFLYGIGEDQVDPLEIQSQFVKTVEDILNSHSTLPYFLQFLQGWGVEKYAKFWLDATSFKAAAETRIKSHDTQAITRKNKLHSGDLLLSDKEKSDIATDESRTPPTYTVCDENETQSLSMTKKSVTRNTKDKVLILPDLVSNIRYANDVTPLNSPDGSSWKVLSCDEQSLEGESSGSRKNVILPNCSEENRGHEVNKGKSESAKDTKNVSSQSAWQCSRAQKLQQDIAEDAMRIFNKYIARDGELSIGVEDIIREEILQKISVVQDDIDPKCFEKAQKMVFGVLERDYLPKFLGSDYFLKHQIDVLTSGSVRLADILYNDSAFPFFMEYVEQEGGRSMLQLWIAASNFRQQLMENGEEYDPQQAQSDSMVLYDKYFSLQATCPQGFSDQVRFEVEGNICREEGLLPSCFNLPLRLVLHILERDYLPGYLSSSLHVKYLSELINTVKTSVELLGRKKRSGSESTCSSEQSSSYGGISTQNTLLAMDTSAPHKFRHLEDPAIAMRIDEAQITDPDSLWRRKNFSKMSCGFINELGRFESEIQPEPDRKTESKISRTLKRFVNMDEDKMKEDMAYKVAEMIIKDVTNITLGSEHSNRSSVGSSHLPLTLPTSLSQDNLSDVFTP